MIDKYVGKIVSHGLADREKITLLYLDSEVTANRDLWDSDQELLKVFDLMNINSLLYAEPAAPYQGILQYFAADENTSLTPNDCENRTFLHDIPLIPELSAKAVSQALSKRKAAIVGGRGIVSYGSVSPEQAFVSFSSVCFSTFVKFFTDVLFHLEDFRAGRLRKNTSLIDAYQQISADSHTASQPLDISAILPRDEDEILRQMAAAGKELVSRRLVDSYFGNISYVRGKTIYISQTGSSLDELETCIDAVPLDGSSSAGITASSELSAHIGIHRKTGMRAILHGHPKFTVIMSMACRREDCDLSSCYCGCREKRSVCGIPVVSGEIGTGRTGLDRTVPDAMVAGKGVIVFGHGIFTAAKESFGPALARMQDVEESCMLEYFKKIQGLI